MNDKKIEVTAALLGITSIILGAFGAHALKKILMPEQLNSFETGVRYQMYHAFFLFFIANNTKINDSNKKSIFYLTIIGVVLFSGSIYLLACNSFFIFDFKKIGFTTPIGGLFLISAWAVLIKKMLKK